MPVCFELLHLQYGKAVAVSNTTTFTVVKIPQAHKACMSNLVQVLKRTVHWGTVHNYAGVGAWDLFRGHLQGEAFWRRHRNTLIIVNATTAHILFSNLVHSTWQADTFFWILFSGTGMQYTVCVCVEGKLSCPSVDECRMSHCNSHHDHVLVLIDLMALWPPCG